MAYFDSAKNRALWQNELEGLTAERERRKNGGPGAASGISMQDTGNLMVEKISFAALLAEHQAASVKTGAPVRERKTELKLSSPSMGHRSL